MIEGLQALYHRELRRFDPPLGRPLIPLRHFGFHQPQQEALEVHSMLGALLRQLGVLARHGRQLQQLQVVLQQHLRRVHQSAPAGISV
jgi:hypothetical protein